MKRKLVVVLLSLSLTAGMLAGCGNTGSETTPVVSGNSNLVEGEYTVGISQFAEHASLDNCLDGFLDGLAEGGFVEGENLTVIRENAQADMGTATQIAQNLVTQNVDLICGIATSSAQSAYNAASKAGIPVIFTAITDPIAADLAKSDGSPAGEVTGVSDALPVEAQLKMIREVMPNAKTIGILYTTSEVNSESAVNVYESLAGKYGFTIETVGVNTIADVPGATDSILGKVDCLSNLTDNTVVSALPTVLSKASERGIPVFGSEVEQVKIGCLASEGIEYVALGKQAGKMAAKVLKGEAKASDMPFETVKESSLYLNEAVAKNLKITFADTLKARATEIFTEISAN